MSLFFCNLRYYVAIFLGFCQSVRFIRLLTQRRNSAEIKIVCKRLREEE